MSCSKNKVVNEMVMKDMIKKDMSLFTPYPTEKVLNYIEMITNRARTEYKVDMGPLFYVSRPSQISTQPATLVPNDPAFEAIDMSDKAIENELDSVIAMVRYDSITMKEFEERDTEANVQVVEGEVLPSDFLPRIIIDC